MSKSTPDKSKDTQLARRLRVLRHAQKQHTALFAWGCQEDGIAPELLIQQQLAAICEFLQENADKFRSVSPMAIEAESIYETLKAIHANNLKNGTATTAALPTGAPRGVTTH